MQETQVQFLGQEDPLEKEMATHSSSCLENPTDRGAWQATVHGVPRVGHDLATKPPPPPCPVVGLPGHMIVLVLVFKEPPHCSS